jgi:hypothetical protein
VLLPLLLLLPQHHLPVLLAAAAALMLRLLVLACSATHDSAEIAIQLLLHLLLRCGSAAAAAGRGHLTSAPEGSAASG